MSAPLSSPNNLYIKLVRQDDLPFSVLLAGLPPNRQGIAAALYSFWRGLVPFALWQEDDPYNFINSWRQSIFFAESYSGDLTVSQNAWVDLQAYFPEYARTYILDVLNGLEMSVGIIRFSCYEHLEHYLMSVGGAIALSSTLIIDAEEIQASSRNFSQPIRKFGALFLWWQLLKHTNLLAKEGKNFIPLDELASFGCQESDLTASSGNPSPALKQLSEFILGRLMTQFSMLAEEMQGFPPILAEAIGVLSKDCKQEMSLALKGGWSLSATLPVMKSRRG